MNSTYTLSRPRSKETFIVSKLVRQGKNVKIVGLNNSGKTTLLKSLQQELASMNPLLENTYGQMKENGSDTNHGLFLIDEAITMFSPWYEKSSRSAYLQRLQRLFQNGTFAVFALHKETRDAEEEFDRVFPNTERFVLNAQLPLNDAFLFIKNQDLRINGKPLLLGENAARKLIGIAGRTPYFLDKVLREIRDSIKVCGCYPNQSFVEITPDMIDEQRIISNISREPCGWIMRLNPDELSFLKGTLTRSEVNNLQIAQELAALGILDTSKGTLEVPGSAVRESFRRTIEMIDSSI